MESLKILIAALAVLLGLQSTAQTNNFIRPGLIRTQLTLSPGYRFAAKESFFYAHGTSEAYLERNVSLAGEGYFGIGTVSTTKGTFDHNHSLFFGINKHFVAGNNDFYIGFQPGVSYIKLNADVNELPISGGGIAPIVSGVFGYNYYVTRMFHFFVQGRLMTGQHNYNQRTDLTEFRISAGLGFNINTIRQK